MPKTTVAPETRIAEREALLPLYNVVLLDDNDHSYDYVVEMLQMLFIFTLEEAFRHAEEVDRCGRTVIITCERPQAEFARDQIHAYGPDPRLPRCAASMSAIIEPARSSLARLRCVGRLLISGGILHPPAVSALRLGKIHGMLPLRRAQVGLARMVQQIQRAADQSARERGTLEEEIQELEQTITHVFILAGLGARGWGLGIRASRAALRRTRRGPSPAHPASLRIRMYATEYPVVGQFELLTNTLMLTCGPRFAHA